MNPVIAILLALATTTSVLKLAEGNQCCSFPCQNGGVCMTKGYDDYICDCANSDFYGRNCETPYILKRISLWFKPSPNTMNYVLSHFKPFWSFINYFDFIREAAMRAVVMKRTNVIDSPPTYNSEYHYVTTEAYFNTSYYTRTLPPIPPDCPLPMGAKGPKEMPDIDVLIKKFFERKTFTPEPSGTSALFPFFAQHFTHQFFKTDVKRGPQFQFGNHGVDLSNVYGLHKGHELLLRSMKDGKMKTQVINGEEWPPNVKDAPVPMTYKETTPDEYKFALGHSFFGILPGLMMISTVYIREHNQICDILKSEHPDWGDEQLFQTARMANIASTLRMVIQDYIQHLSGYHIKLLFKPEILYGYPFQYQNRIAVEFNHLYHWHPLMPTDFQFEDVNLTVSDILYNSEMLVKYGLPKFATGLSKTRAGKFGLRNHDKSTFYPLRLVLKYGRQLRLQPFNQYRKKFNLPPYKSFEEWTGDAKLSKELEELYGDIDAVEFYVGLILEKSRGGFFGESVTEIGAPYSVFGLYANPLCSPRYWKPSTFGGDTIFERVKNIDAGKFFCRNIKGECPYISFAVPKK